MKQVRSSNYYITKSMSLFSALTLPKNSIGFYAIGHVDQAVSKLLLFCFSVDVRVDRDFAHVTVH